jgi:hypothetical protein
MWLLRALGVIVGLIIMVIGLVVLAGVVAIFMQPSRESFEQYFHEKLVASIRAGSIDTESGLISQFAQFTCKTDPEACANLLRPLFDFREEDAKIFRGMVIYENDKPKVIFIGAFGRWWEIKSKNPE